MIAKGEAKNEWTMVAYVLDIGAVLCERVCMCVFMCFYDCGKKL